MMPYMGKTPCFVCQKNLGWKDFGHSTINYRDFVHLMPKNLIDSDKVCNKCYDVAYDKHHNADKIKKDAEKLAIQNAQKAEMAALKARVPEYKPNWNQGGVIEYKDEYCAILYRGRGAQVEFMIAFSDITKEGYRLMVQDEGKTASAGGFSGGVDSYYYFQKLQ